MERWDLLDAEGNRTGKTIVRGEYLRSGQYHLVEHIWIVDSKGRMLIQRRADHLRLMPGVWAVNSGSAVAGEDSESAARRELFEELSIRTAPGELKYGGRMRRRNSFTDFWLLFRDIDHTSLRLQKEEVAEVKWVTADELVAMLGEGLFHHYGVPYFQFVFRAIEKGRKTLYLADLDGTLLRDDETFSQETVDTVNHLISRGMMVSVATARGIVGTALVGLERFRFRVPVVLLNGTVLYDTEHKRILQCCDIPAHTVDGVLKAFASVGRTPQVYRRRGDEIHAYFTALNPIEEEFMNRVDASGRSYGRFVHRVPQLRSSPAVYFSCQDTKEKQTVLKEALDRVPGIRVSFYQDGYHEDNWFIEIAREDTGKDRGAERLRQRLRAQRLVAFGDNLNDLPLFQIADLAVCVDNALPEVKAVADVIIDSNEADGVAVYLNDQYNRKLV